MTSIISALFSALLNGLLGLFRKSPEQKLGETEVRLEDAEKENAFLKTVIAADRAADSDTSGELLDGLNELNGKAK